MLHKHSQRETNKKEEEKKSYKRVIEENIDASTLVSLKQRSNHSNSIQRNHI